MLLPPPRGYFVYLSPSSSPGNGSSRPAPSPPPAPLLPGLGRARCERPRFPPAPRVPSSCSAITNSPGPNPASSGSRGLCPAVCPRPGYGQTLPSSTGAVSPPQTCREQVQNSLKSTEAPRTPPGARPATGTRRCHARTGTGIAGLHRGPPAPLSRHGVGHCSSGWLPGAGKGRSEARLFC